MITDERLRKLCIIDKVQKPKWLYYVKGSKTIKTEMELNTVTMHIYCSESVHKTIEKQEGKKNCNVFVV